MDFIKEREKIIHQINCIEEIIGTNFDENIIKKLSNLKNQIKEDLTFNILCLGDFSSGKSTFINNFFIGESLLPTHDTTTTARLTLIKKGIPSLKIINQNGESEFFDTNFKEILSQSVAKEGSKLNVTNKVELSINSELLSEGIVIVDSPGLNDPEIERMNVTYEYLNSADCIIYMMHAGGAYMKHEKDFLENNIFQKKNLDKLIFVMSRWDIIPKNQRELVFKYVETQIEESITKIRREQQNKNIKTPKLFALSSKTKENFEQLENEIKCYFKNITFEEIINKKQQNIKILISEIINNINELIHIKTLSIEEIDKDINSLSNEICRFENEIELFQNELSNEIEVFFIDWVKTLKKEYSEISENIVEKLKNDIDKILNIEDLKKYLKFSIRKSLDRKEDSLENTYNTFIRSIKNHLRQKEAKFNISNHKIVDFNSLTKYDFDYEEIISSKKIDEFRKPKNLIDCIPAFIKFILKK